MPFRPTEIPGAHGFVTQTETSDGVGRQTALSEFRASRIPGAHGFVTQSEEGKPVSEFRPTGIPGGGYGNIPRAGIQRGIDRES